MNKNANPQSQVPSPTFKLTPSPTPPPSQQSSGGSHSQQGHTELGRELPSPTHVLTS